MIVSCNLIPPLDFAFCTEAHNLHSAGLHLWVGNPKVGETANCVALLAHGTLSAGAALRRSQPR